MCDNVPYGETSHTAYLPLRSEGDATSFVDGLLLLLAITTATTASNAAPTTESTTASTMTTVPVPDGGEDEGADADSEGVEEPPSWAVAGVVLMGPLPTIGETLVPAAGAATSADLEDDEGGAGGGLGGKGGSRVSIEVAWVEMPVMP